MSLFSSMFPTSHQVMSKLALCINLLACLFPFGLRAPDGQSSVLFIFVSWCLAQSLLNWNQMSSKKRICQRIHTHGCLHWHPLPQPWLLLGLWTHHRGLLSGATAHPWKAYSSRQRRNNSPFGHVTRKFSNWPVLFSYDTFSKIIPISFHFWSSHQTSYFLWFGDLNGYSCGPKWILGSSLQSLPSSSLSPPVIHLPSPDRDNGSFFSSNFLWVVSLHLYPQESQMSPCCHLCFLFPLSSSAVSFLLHSSSNLQLSLEFLF